MTIMTRKRFQVLIVLFLVFAARIFAYEKTRLIPGVTVEGQEVKITVTTFYPSSDMRLYLNFEDEARRDYHPFPPYMYTLTDKKEFMNNHEFVVPIAPQTPRYVRSIPPGVVVHFRLSCVMYVDKKAVPVRSKDYSFRIIKDKNNAFKAGLCFTRTPVVANVYDDKATITWESNYPSQTRFIYYHKRQNMPAVIETKESHRRVEIALEGLRPETKYDYQIEVFSTETNDSYLSPVMNFWSAPKGNNFAFAVMGDSRANSMSIEPDANINGVNVHELNALSYLAYLSGARFILFPGDLINGYTEDVNDVHLQYDTWCDAIAPIRSRIPYYAGMGNHDTSAPWRSFTPTEDNKDLPYPETIWADVFVLPENGPGACKDMPPYTENVYSFNYGNCHFVMLNSDYNFLKDAPRDAIYVRYLDEMQRQWLEIDLKSNLDKDFLFVAFHQPAYPTSAHYGKSLDRFPAERDALWTILDKYNVDAVFVGHEHIYTRLLVDSAINPAWNNEVWQITTGRAGAPWYPINKEAPWIQNVKRYNYNPHFVRIEVKGSKIGCKVYDIDGAVIDEFVLHKKKRPRKQLLEETQAGK